MKRPKPFGVHPARVRVADGPRPDGKWYWRADKPDGAGGRLPVWVGWGTVEEAAEETRKALGAAGLDPIGELETVRDLLEAWVASVEDREDASEHTIRACKHAGIRLLAHSLGPVPLVSVNRRHLDEHRDEALRAGVAGSTLVRDLKYLRQAWAWGMDLQQILRPLPRCRVERKARQPVRTRYTPTTAEVVALLRAVSPSARRALVLLAVTGARIGEVVSLTWGAIARDGTRLRVDGKTGERWIALPDPVVEEIATWERGPHDRRVVEIAEGVIRASLALHSEKLCGGRVSPNGLRRHVVDALYATGQIDAAASQMGHSAQTALGVYRQVGDEDRQRVVAASGLGTHLSEYLSETREKASKEAGKEYSQGETAASKATLQRRESRYDDSRAPPSAAQRVTTLSEHRALTARPTGPLDVRIAVVVGGVVLELDPGTARELGYALCRAAANAELDVARAGRWRSPRHRCATPNPTSS